MLDLKRRRMPPRLSPQPTSNPSTRATYQSPNRPQSCSGSLGKSSSKSTPERSSKRLMHLSVSNGHNTNVSGDRHCGWPRSQTHFGDQRAALGMRESNIKPNQHRSSNVRGGGYQWITEAFKKMFFYVFSIIIIF